MDRSNALENKAGEMSDLAFHKLIEGIKKSRLIFEHLGITVRMMELPSWPLYEHCRNDYYGTSLLGRFWCQKLRPILKPKVHEQKAEAWEDARYHMQVDMINAVLEKGNE